MTRAIYSVVSGVAGNTFRIGLETPAIATTEYCLIKIVSLKMISIPYCAVSLDGMRIDVIRYEPHTLSLKPFKLFFQQFHSCEVVSSSHMRKNETFCDVS